jgi:hypothetical protein
MHVPTYTKPTMWGAVGGAIATIVLGFAWGGWVTGGSAEERAATSAEDAIVLAFTPLCIAKAGEQSERIRLLKQESGFKRADFVIEAGWVADVTEDYRSKVAEACASAVVRALDAPAVPAS